LNGQVQFINTSLGTGTSSAIGENTSTVGNYSFTGGVNSTTNSDLSFSFGEDNNTNFSLSTIFGKQNTADGEFSYLFGENLHSTGQKTYSFGDQNYISGNFAYILGKSTNITGDNSFSIGSNNEIFSSNSFLFGNNLSSSGNIDNCFIIGNGIQGNPLNGTISNSLYIGFNSNIPTLFVGSSNGLNTSGRIGIGTSNPVNKLDILGNVSIGFNSSTSAPLNGLAVYGDMGLGMNNPGSKFQINGNAAIGFINPTSAPTNGLLINGDLGIGTITPGSKMQIDGNVAIGYNSYTTAPTNGITVSGELGIGTTQPYGKTEIVQTGTSPALSLRTDHTDNAPIIRFFTNQTTQPAGPHNYFELATISTSANFTSTNPLDHKCLSLELSNGYNFSVENGGLFVGYDDYTISQLKIAPKGLSVFGDVSIGMEPLSGYGLSVNGNLYGLGQLSLGPINNYGVNEFVISKQIDNLANAGIFYNHDPTPTNVSNNDNEFNFVFDNSSSGTYNFYKTTEKYLFTITTDGNIGIKQAQPLATLHIKEESFDLDPSKCKDVIRVDGKDGTAYHPHFLVKSNGFVYAREINVLLGNLPTSFPDYVFSKDYNLMTLDTLEQYINSLKHLPEVPTAQYMAENGINTGEMSVLLLKKIEELTLHIIELNKRIEKLESKPVEFE
jgi:hypothetical protein